jgi:hypothetical protein
VCVSMGVCLCVLIHVRPFSDQLALVPRRLAPAYFTAIESYYLCSEAWWFPPALGAADLLLAKHLAQHQVHFSFLPSACTSQCAIL